MIAVRVESVSPVMLGSAMYRGLCSDARVRTAGRDRGVHGSGAEVRMMSTLSTAAWAAHDVGLATAVGGTLYGRAALEPALHEIADPIERDRVSVSQRLRLMLVSP